MIDAQVEKLLHSMDGEDDKDSQNELKQQRQWHFYVMNLSKGKGILKKCFLIYNCFKNYTRNSQTNHIMSYLGSCTQLIMWVYLQNHTFTVSPL